MTWEDLRPSLHPGPMETAQVRQPHYSLLNPLMSLGYFLSFQAIRAGVGGSAEASSAPLPARVRHVVSPLAPVYKAGASLPQSPHSQQATVQSAVPY